MRLKKLTLHGFKSFADRTELEFDRGITAIVGPNGCGKSNVVDAVKWVLGEQSAKSLRGSQMMDVIFNGSQSRKSMGMAEVTLTFDNGEGTLPMDQTEVVVSRRLYRSGQSEYLLNGKACRLRDIRELFMDTGVGIDAYSLIEQGKVDLLLQASPHERRMVLEEAAGISKYKARRKEACRRLENVEQNLLRVGDIVEEVEKRLRSVKYQAGKARNYQQYMEELKSLKSRHFLVEYHTLLQRQGELRCQLDQARQQQQGLENQISTADARRSELDLEQIELNNDIARIENQLVQLDSRITSSQQQCAMLHQRIDEQSELLRTSSIRAIGQRAQVQHLIRQQDLIQGQLDELAAEDQRCSQQIDACQQKHQQRNMELAQLRCQLEEAKSGTIELMRQQATLNNRLSSVTTHAEALKGQRQRLQNRSEQLADQLGQLRRQQAAVQQQLAQVDGVLEEKQSQLSHADQQAHQLNDQADQLSGQLSDLREKRTALASRQQVLADMEARLEGVGAAVRKLLEQAREKPEQFAPVRGLVADLIKADVSQAALVEAALAGRDQYVVVDRGGWVLENRALLDELPGQLNVICLDMLPPLIGVRDFTGCEGVIGLASDLVHADDELDHLVRLLLGKTVLVETLDVAVSLRAEDTAGYRFITRDGQIVEADGTLRIGLHGSTSGLISRKSELTAIEGQLADLHVQIKQYEQELAQVQQRCHDVDRHQQQLRAAIQDGRTQQVKLQAQASNLDEQIRRLADEQPLIESEMHAIDTQIQQCQQSAAEAREAIDRLESSSHDYQSRVEQLEQQIQHAQQHREQIGEQLTQLRIQAGQLAEKRRALIDRLNSLRQRHQALLAEQQTARHDMETARQRIEQAEQAILQIDSVLAGFYSDVQQLQKQNAQCRGRRVQIREQLTHLEEQLQDLRSQADRIRQASQELALQINELTVRQETLIQRVQDELDMDLQKAHADYDPDQQQDWEQLKQQIDELRRKIDRLGNVNLDAINEQQELEDRLKFLSEQRDDLLEAQKRLEALIAKLDQESQQRFVETFEAVRENFQQLFRKLFGGGRADLVLEQPDSVLESGIDIVARPPGKEQRSISLLSGGEKTLTTVALLFSIFKSKPSPFCLLDEVDAALDEANIDRFNLLLEEFLQHSQFIVITHSKRTMSYANTLYGITMQEAGVSKKVSVRFEDNTQKPQSDSEAA